MEFLITTLIYWIIFWILCGIVASVIAHNKGRSSFGWFIFGFLLGPFGIILALVVSKNEEVVAEKAIQSGKMKKCPHCAELVKVKAIKCRFCGEDLEPQTTKKIKTSVEIIALRNVEMRFGAVTALSSIDLQIAAGQTTVLIGPSGCGKSTILRLIIGLLTPTSGAVEFEGDLISQGSILALRRRMGYVIQDGGLFPHLTAAQNVTLMVQHLQSTPQENEIQAKLDELCELTYFPKDGLARYPVELSGGQRQRVSLMRALALDPDVLLLDEPLGALDPMVRASLQTELKEIFNRLGKTVLLVTHDMAEAGYIGDSIVLMREGHVLQQGTLDDLRERPADDFVSEFITAQRSLVQL